MGQAGGASRVIKLVESDRVIDSAASIAELRFKASFEITVSMVDFGSFKLPKSLASSVWEKVHRMTMAP